MLGISYDEFFRKLCGKLDESHTKKLLIDCDFTINGWHITDDPDLFESIQSYINSGQLTLSKNPNKHTNFSRFLCACNNEKYIEFGDTFFLPYVRYPGHNYRLDKYCAQEIENIPSKLYSYHGYPIFIELYSKFFLFQQSQTSTLDITFYIGYIYVKLFFSG